MCQEIGCGWHRMNNALCFNSFDHYVQKYKIELSYLFTIPLPLNQKHIEWSSNSKHKAYSADISQVRVNFLTPQQWSVFECPIRVITPGSE